MKKAIFFGFMIAMFASCSNQSHVYRVTNSSPEVTPEVREILIGGAPVRSYPNATAFRMSGDYGSNVAVTLSPSGDVTYFPAPSDITAYSEPISLGDGWWLNCQGLGPNSVFTKYTFAEYAALPAAPSPQQIKQSVLPGARVVQFIELPMKLNEAVNNLEEVKSYLKNK